MASHRARIAAPFVVTGLIAAGAWAPSLRASAAPDLAPVGAQQLVTRVLTEHVSHLSGTFEWRAALGLPSLSGLTAGGGQGVSSATGFDPTGLVSGTHDFQVWVDGPYLQRIAAPGSLSESDVVHRGNQAWVYDSSTDHVTHYTVSGPTGRSGIGGGMASRLHGATPLDGMTVTSLAAELLAGVRSVGSTVSVSSPTTVAGQKAYVLRVAPNRALAANRVSTVADATIAVDARTGLPLRVSIYALHESGPALQVGFTSISYAVPAASLFAAPTGQTTTDKAVVAPSGGLRHRDAGNRPRRGWYGSAPLQSPRRIDTHPAHRPTSTSNWGAVASFPAASLTGGTARQLDAVTTVVSGRWGSGRLLTSTLVNALFTSSGRVYVGAVTPAALEAAAASSR